MNRYIALDNIFNYIGSYIREHQADDDQLKSWALQGLRKLNYPNIRNVEDFDFFELKNGYWNIPARVKSIISVEYLKTDLLKNIEDYIAENPQFDVTYFNNNYDKENNIFKHLEPVESKAYDYYCKVQDCRDIYTITDDLLQSPINSGNACLAVKFWTPYTKDNQIVLPEHPELIWQFLAAHAEYEHWRERADRGEQGAERRENEYKMKALGYLQGTQNQLVWRNFKIRNAKHNLYAESNITRLYTYLTQNSR